ncbi:MAG: CDP-diacylglycerol--glycerol-3-phosphate 3-phosphatidyltransferase [Melioribacteraceae bacterium]|jgi:CDP-diacylglycerol--glycerol-3-phosphate 3-phosphatidyltransferase|nr:CDP-diacylglycerol--glycerol-3-phosphate 3-phosphatidyltransferase [Melioribacteraceae bacterium]
MVLPNQLTVLRIILTPIFLYFFLSDDPVMIQISSVIFVIAAITDWYDGWLARKFNYITDWGKFLDPLADKILTLTAFYGFVVIDVIPFWMVIIIIIRDMGITLLRIFAEIKKKSFATSRSAQWKTFIQMFFLYYLLIIYTLRTIEPVYNWNPWLFDLLFNQEIIYYIMLVITIFTLYTGIQYLVKNRKMIRKLFLGEA